MLQVTAEQVLAALQATGIQPGDGVLVHSAIQYLGQPLGGVAMYYTALCQTLDITSGLTPASPGSGTLAVPAFNFLFARGEPYDPQTTPAVGMGALSEYVRQRAEARRTPHPMQSLAVVGRYAADLARRDTASAFDPGSVYERMLELDFKLLLLGADIQAVSMLHYCEQRAKVPYRYWKEFTGPYHTPHGWEQRSYRMFVRDLQLDPKIELYPVQRSLQERGKWYSAPLNYGQVACCRLVDFVAEIDRFLEQDAWLLVTNRPAQGSSTR
jgi:aminoglycoside 3-N-acetyltransferase